MNVYLHLTRLAFQRQMSYRAATLAGLTTNFFFGLLRAAIMIALYQNRDVVAGYDLPMAITFTALGQGMIAYLSLFHWYDLMYTVYSGEVATDLLKPVGYFRYWLAKDFGRAVSAFLTRGVTILIAYELVLDLVYPQGWKGWLYFAAAILLGWLVGFGFRFLVNMISFWTPNAAGFGRFFFLSAYALSGMLMPLAFYPEIVQKIAYITPFPQTVYVPIEIFLGLLNESQIWNALGRQALWAVGLILAGQIVQRAGVRRLVVQGG
ncbi:MAG TPA: ABC-2 family transporter protein [Anaerolineales bacterium]|nr:ABC-2 family transporter protein [Anaerolineales bacterium]